jgi:hypothetical protein
VTPAHIRPTFRFKDRIRSLDFHPTDVAHENRYKAFIDRYRAFIGGVNFNAPDPEMGLTYDCLYMQLYAILWLLRSDSNATISLDAIREALLILKPLGSEPAPLVETGPEDIQVASSTLAQGQRIDLDGLFGPLRLDPAKRAPVMNLHVVCDKVVSNHIPTVKSGQYYDVESGEILGDWTCPQ